RGRRQPRRKVVVISPVSGSMALPWFFGPLDAYVAGKALHTTVMYPKMDQNFKSYATPWELEWSNIVSPSDRAFTPIVNQSWEVIGYMGRAGTGPVGWFGGAWGSLILPKKVGGTMELDEAMRRGIPVFVHSAIGVPNGWDNGQFYTSEHRLMVRTTIDGQVVDYQLSNTGFLEQPWYSPTDLYMAGKIMVNLGKIGFRIASSYVLKSTAKFQG